MYVYIFTQLSNINFCLFFIFWPDLLAAHLYNAINILFQTNDPYPKLLPNYFICSNVNSNMLSLLRKTPMYQVQSNNLQTILKRNLDSIGGGQLIKKSDNDEVRF